MIIIILIISTFINPQCPSTKHQSMAPSVKDSLKVLQSLRGEASKVNKKMKGRGKKEGKDGKREGMGSNRGFFSDWNKLK